MAQSNQDGAPALAKKTSQSGVVTPVDLTEITTLQGFLWRCFEIKKSRFPRLSFAQIARQGNFSSRSNVRLMLLGEKAVTLTSLEQFSQAFSLSETQHAFAKALLEWERAKRLGDTKKSLQTQAQCRTLRSLVSKDEAQKTLTPAVARQLLRRFSSRWMRVFATLGNGRSTATPLAEIASISGLPSAECLSVLNILNDARCVEHLDKKWWWTDIAFIDQSGLEDDVLRDTFLSNFERIKKTFLQRSRAPTSQKATDGDLFLTAECLVAKAQRHAFKKSLREAVLKVLRAYECRGGDQIVTLSLGAVHSGNKNPR